MFGANNTIVGIKIFISLAKIKQITSQFFIFREAKISCSNSFSFCIWAATHSTSARHLVHNFVLATRLPWGQVLRVHLAGHGHSGDVSGRSAWVILSRRVGLCRGRSQGRGALCVILTSRTPPIGSPLCASVNLDHFYVFCILHSRSLLFLPPLLLSPVPLHPPRISSRCSYP